MGAHFEELHDDRDANDRAQRARDRRQQGHRARDRDQFRQGRRRRGDRGAPQARLEEARAGIIAAAGGAAKVVAIPGDVSTGPDCTRVFKAAEAALGRVDVLVNNAGTSQAMPFAKVTDEMWQADFDLKVFAAIRLARLAMPGMEARKWGRIINILNIGAKVPRAASVPTSVSRAAGLALTKVLANEGAPHNILVNGAARRPDQERAARGEERQAGNNRSMEDVYAEMGTRIPLGRVGEARSSPTSRCSSPPMPAPT